MFSNVYYNPVLRMLILLNPSWDMVYLFLCTIILCMIYQIVFHIKVRKKPQIKHLAIILLFLFYLMHIYRVTGIFGLIWGLNRSGPLIIPDRVYLIPFSSSSSPVPYLLNILMTIPLGIFLPLIWPSFRSMKKVAMTGFFFSLAIEVSQLFLIRSSTTDDLIMNTFGTILGYLIFIRIEAFFRNRNVNKKDTTIFIDGINHKPLTYFVLSFLGMLFIYHPAIASRLPQSQRFTGEVSIEDTSMSLREWEDLSDEEQHDYSLNQFEEIDGQIRGTVIEIKEGIIQIEQGLLMESEDLGMIATSPAPGATIDEEARVTVIFNDDISVELVSGDWRNPIITKGTITDLAIEDNLTFHGYWDGDIFIAEKIVLFRV